MSLQLVLEVHDFRGDTDWRWVLADPDGRYLADHEVALDRADPVFAGFDDLPRQLAYLQPARAAADILAEVGTWMGAKVFGAVGECMLEYEQAPACVVEVRVPPAAQSLLFRPFELARVGGQTLAERGFRFVYTVAAGDGAAAGHAARPAPAKDEAGPLRVLGVFSLPYDASPLNLRQERQRLQQLLHRVVQAGRRDVQWRVLQYGATRDELRELLQDAPGWDVVHFAGHGTQGELVLEQPDGTADRIEAAELMKLLRLTRRRLKLLTLSACYSGAADVRAARLQVGLDARSARDIEVALPEATQTVLPSLGQRLAEELDCAVVAMRYPVLDRFATDLALELFEGLLLKRQPLPEALQLALDDALGARGAASDGASRGATGELSRITPLLFGARASALRLVPPPRTQIAVEPPTGLIHFPDPPAHFVGRLLPMLRAGRALAPESGQTGVIFYGMAGAGKTACALELAHRYDTRYTTRFSGFAWYKAPDEGDDVAGALTAFVTALETQLDLRALALVGLVDNPATFRAQALPRLRWLMQEQAVLVVLDNLEGLLTSRDEWRDARWGELLTALTEHDGLGRVVLTSRRLPATLAASARVQREAIHALSFPESVLLARELPHLGRLFGDDAGRATLRRVLEIMQGHPKLLELADARAAGSVTLDAHLARAEREAVRGSAATSAFFTTGETDRPEDAFVRVLHGWTDDVTATLSPTARLLAYVLARVEADDGTSSLLDGNWEDVLRRLTGERGGSPAPEPAGAWARTALAEPGLGRERAERELATAGLVDVETITSGEPEISSEDLGELLELVAAQQGADSGAVASDVLSHVRAALTDPAPALRSWLDAHRRRTHRFRVHPGVAEALRATAPAGVLAAVDWEVGDYFLAHLRQGLRTELEGGGPLVVAGARRATPYLLRAGRWEEAATALEQLIQRDRQAATVAFALPVLRRIVDETRDTPTGVENAGVLATALVAAGQRREARQLLEETIARSVAQDNYRLASTGATFLCNLLQQLGHFEEALKVAEAKAEYTRRAGLGPWTMLSAQGLRLQVLGAMGRYGEVLSEVERLRPRLRSLPEKSDAPETATPWNVREGLLDVGRSAAMGLEQWDAALALNAEIFDLTDRRGADALELARTRFNDYAPLLRQGRLAECRQVVDACRTVFEQANAIGELGTVFSALGNLEGREGRWGDAVSFEQAALRYRYQNGDPEGCAISHNNLANSLEHVGTPDLVLAHQLAGALICLQIQSGMLERSVRNLARAAMPPAPPSFDEIVASVERVDGVRFGALFAALPARHASGDEALREIWARVAAEQQRSEQQRAALERSLAAVPAAVRDALAANDPERGIAALAALPEGERDQVIATLFAASGRDPAEVADATRRQVVARFDPLLAEIAAVAEGRSESRPQLETRLATLEQKGWHLTDAVHRIWDGERDAAVLTTGLDQQDTALVHRVLELLA